MLFHDLVNTCVEQLGIKCPYEIKVKPGFKKGMLGKYVCWHYKNGKRKHVITLYMESINQDSRKVETLIAHEFVHAWQEENGYSEEVHGKSFKTMAKVLEKVLRLKGFPVKNLYIKGTDL